MASSHAARQWLEAVKFSVYLVSPICATIFLGTGAYPYLESIIANREYVKYPAEGERVKPKQVEELAKEMKRRRIAASESSDATHID